MRLSFAPLFSLIFHIRLSSGIKSVRALPGPASDVLSTSSLADRHTSYIDQKVRYDGLISLNHESYHQRHVSAFPNQSVTTSPPSSTSSAILDPSMQPLANLSTSRHSSLVQFLHTIQASPTDDSSAAYWASEISQACTVALLLLNGHASNPSGISACYNIPSLDNITGTFEANLRLYRIAPPIGDWMGLSGEGLTLGLEFSHVDVIMNKGGKRKRGFATVEVPFVQRNGARDMWRRRADGVVPKMLEDLSITGEIDKKIAGGNMNGDLLLSILTPNITLYGTTQGGTPVITELSMNNTSFLVGVLARQGIINATTNASTPVAAGFKKEYVLPGTSLVGFPTGLVMTSVWSLLLVAIEGYEIWKRVQARDVYRRRVKEKLSGGGSNASRAYGRQELSVSKDYGGF